MCRGCHALDVAVSTPQTKERWRIIVEDMVARGATGKPAEIQTAINYLAVHYGKPGVASEKPTPAPVAATVHTGANLTVTPNVPAASQWPSYGHDPGGQRYSPLKQITTENVARLAPAWTFHMGKTGSESTPLVINSVMYFTSSDGIFAVQPETGNLLWKYSSTAVARRGLVYWNGNGKSDRPRLFCGVENGKLVALDALTGQPAKDFGDNGLVDLRRGVFDEPSDTRLYLASPPAIFKDIVITGSNNGELAPSVGAYGDVRGWDAHTGKLLWTFHTVPRPGEPGNETWAPGSWKNRSGTNVWGLMTVDVERGLVFLPIGCPTSDMYGADRRGDGLYGNSLVALDAATGKVKWYRQLVHHDLWDFDLAAPPALIDVARNGRKIPAVAQITKMSTLFLFDRTNGEPIFGIEERPVPQSKVPGRSQFPHPAIPPEAPAAGAHGIQQRRLLRSDSGTCRILPRSVREKTKCSPKALLRQCLSKGTRLLFPARSAEGTGVELSYDPSLGYVFTNVMDLGQWGHMALKTDPKTGQTTYARTAAFGGAYGRFWNPDTHIPCQKPPFGEMVAVNVNTGEIAWKVPLGTVESLEAKGIKNTGTLNMGGSIATAGGLVFIGATNDSRIHAFDSRTGKELWTGKLDASAYSVPVTYQGRDGRQYVAIVAGGGGSWASPTGDSLMAFALP